MRIAKGKSRLRPARKNENLFSPMEGVANIVDVMLVFACGLIIALIAAWNVDVTKTPYDVESIQENSGSEEVDQNKLEEMGHVYKDPDTGKLYVIEDGE